VLYNDALKTALSKKILIPRDKRCAIAVMQETTGISQRRACSLVGLSLSVLSCRSEKQTDDTLLQNRPRELALERKRFGHRQLHGLL
jgi:putative transposase